MPVFILPLQAQNVELCFQMQAFHEWLQEQMDERGWSQSELHRQADIDTGTISNLLNQVRPAGPEICRKLAKAFGLPQPVVFFHAGLITEDPNDPREVNAVTLDVMNLMENSSDAIQVAIRATVQAMVESFDRGLDGQVDSRSSGTSARSNTS